MSTALYFPDYFPHPTGVMNLLLSLYKASMARPPGNAVGREGTNNSLWVGLG